MIRATSCIIGLLSCSAVSAVAMAQTASPTSDGAAVGEIIVTAQKRTERLRDVPISINVASGDQLKSAGITTSDQLQRIVPGFSAIKTTYGNPVYFLRGVGFNDTTLGVAPAVSIYLDQQPFPYTPLARGAIIDLERVEVLKGPQGTLFGQNSTGGAVNYIAAKPTRDFKAGFDFTYGRFGQADAEGFVSGPVADTLSARLAVQSQNRGPWQKGYTIDQELGKTSFLNGRLSLDWKPTESIDVLLTASGWRDNSDTQQGQFLGWTPNSVGPNARVVPAGFSTFPLAPNDNRASAWDVGGDFKRNDWYYQFSAQVDAELADGLQLTSLTSYSKYKQEIPMDLDVSTFVAFNARDFGYIDVFSQELRVSGESDRFKWMLGANYQWNHTFERQLIFPYITTAAHIRPINFDSQYVDNDQRVKSMGVFGSMDYKLTDQLTFQGSLRYTTHDIVGEGCSRDTGDGTLASAIALLSTRLTGSQQTIAPGACIMLDSVTQTPIPIYRGKLGEENFSFRTSLNWKPNPDTLLYASVAKGYKAGSFPSIASPFVNQISPIGQESVLAYEVGSKFAALNNTVQFSGAMFYYDYRDKQVYGLKSDPVFRTLSALVSIPKSTVKGGELALSIYPFQGLDLSGNITYIDAKVDVNPVNPTGPFGGVAANFEGQSFPFTPKWQAAGSAQYRWDLNQNLSVYVGTSVTWRTNTKAFLVSNNPAFIASERLLDMPGYALLDLRAGIETTDKQWRVEIWGRNVTDTFYNVGVRRQADRVVRFTGMPATYGMSVHYRM